MLERGDTSLKGFFSQKGEMWGQKNGEAQTFVCKRIGGKKRGVPHGRPREKKFWV